MDIEDLHTFVEVADSGGISSAARRLRISKSMVSRRLARLEAELGVRLLARSTRGGSLTEAGVTFREYAAKTCKEIEVARKAILPGEERQWRTLVAVPNSLKIEHMVGQGGMPEQEDNMQEMNQLMKEADAALWADVNEAIDRAVNAAGHELQSLGLVRTPHDYFAEGVLRHLFLRLCGADPETYAGGDPETAWKMLYVGRSIARRWERELGRSGENRKRKDRREDIEKDESERRELILSARNFALKTAISILVDHARASDPQIADRMEAAVEARHAALENVSDTDREFTENARRYMSLLTVVPRQSR
ncbi:LysR family transcriptional regulator [Neorhizobium sp. JUb45]|uniref:LysR family transcriptional regulator n=1 Tax=Neorhizobium sp. JUb45 TaxID=2485113 RepID=UPI001FDF5BBE|nr:LysR family transcriptional regulator [Neorhizobium sp. JUb45]